MISFILKALLVVGIAILAKRLVRGTTVNSTIDNLPGPPNPSFWFGHIKQLLTVNAWDFHAEIAKKYGSIIKAKTILGMNQLYVFDPLAMHHILVKDQAIYEETTLFIRINQVLFGPGLLATLGDHHRKQRKMLNPVFSIKHMRAMIPTFLTISHRLERTLASKLKDGPEEVDMLQWFGRTALELVGQAGLGFSFDPLTEDHIERPYVKAIKNLQSSMQKLLLFTITVFPWASQIGSPEFRRFVVDSLPWKDLHDMRDIVNTMQSTSEEIFAIKKEALAAGDEAVSRQVGQGKDIMSILMKANIEASEEDRLPEVEVIGQMSTLIFAATETTSGALSRTVHLLAQHPETQEKLRAEIRAACENGQDPTYDELVDLPFLDAICRETLRLYPPVNDIHRTTRKDAILPLYTPTTGIDGKEVREVFVPSGTNIILSILSANRNPVVWGPDSMEWKPERWLSPLPETVHSAHLPGIYSNLLTFIGGGRACIGFKFSQLEMKAVLFVLVRTFKFELAKEEIYWQMTNVSSCTVKGDNSGQSRMPLKLSIAD